MYYQKASKSINSDYYNTYTGHVKRATGRSASDMLSTIIKILAIIFLLTLIIFGYIFVSNQYYLSQSASEPIVSSTKASNKVIVGVNTIESVATILKEEEEQLSSEDVTKIVQMVMVKMNSLNEQEEHAKKIVDIGNTRETTVKNPTKAENSKINNSKVVIRERATSSKNVKFIVVKNGDTLSTIAIKLYGDKSAYKKIRDANGEIIKDTNKIYAGQRLRIPL